MALKLFQKKSFEKKHTKSRQTLRLHSYITKLSKEFDRGVLKDAYRLGKTRLLLLEMSAYIKGIINLICQKDYIS